MGEREIVSSIEKDRKLIGYDVHVTHVLLPLVY